MTAGTLRTFLAVPVSLNHSMLETFHKWKEAFPHSYIRWVDPGHTHLTLTFLGETRPRQIQAVQNLLEQELKEFHSFSMYLAGMGIFGGMRDPRVIWMGVNDPSGGMQSLKKITDRVVSRQGIETDDRPFKPHLTLGRPKNIRETGVLKKWLEKYRETVFGEIPVREVVFFESRLGSEGPLYTVINSFPLVQP